ncbi:hypothetical protein AK812_SmicGene25360 [Symbiodinium microadriaticum]|uniref:Uncharacterized protein n=1 Tax=Symbiodinium microadriaticum TaxID=2951 RepID=A0A1Q9DC78_SYMMI|nr:hypothetical protein AK812_SmicGene25360 [Symbiodinium microadriaticum]
MSGKQASAMEREKECRCISRSNMPPTRAPEKSPVLASALPRLDQAHGLKSAASVNEDPLGLKRRGRRSQGAQVMRFHSAPPLPYGSETDVPPPSPRPRGGIPLGMSIPELPLPGQDACTGGSGDNEVNVPEPDTGGTEVPWAQQRRFPADGPMAIRWPMPSGRQPLLRGSACASLTAMLRSSGGNLAPQLNRKLSDQPRTTFHSRPSGHGRTRLRDVAKPTPQLDEAYNKCLQSISEVFPDRERGMACSKPHSPSRDRTMTQRAEFCNFRLTSTLSQRNSTHVVSHRNLSIWEVIASTETQPNQRGDHEILYRYRSTTGTLHNLTGRGFVKALGGGVGALFSTTVLYPLEVTKTKVQAFAGEASTDEGFDEEKHQAMGNTFRALHYTWKKEGFQALLAPWAPGWPSTCLAVFRLTNGMQVCNDR